jgi:hypothetical protein
MLKKILTWGAIAFVVFFVAFRPGAAADTLRTLGDTAASIFAGIGGFFGGLVS